MICDECRWEADQDAYDMDHGLDLVRSGIAGHVACKGGTHCMCQHKEVGSDSYIPKAR